MTIQEAYDAITTGDYDDLYDTLEALSDSAFDRGMETGFEYADWAAAE